MDEFCASEKNSTKDLAFSSHFGILKIMLRVAARATDSISVAACQSICISIRFFHATNALTLNRIFVERLEVCTESEYSQLITFPTSDDRFQHMDKILKIQAGDIIKMGVVDEGITDTAKVVEKNEREVVIDLGSDMDLHATPRPPIDLILAFPRPARLTWLFPVISSLGVGRISLIRAAKTEKGYMGKSNCNSWFIIIV